MWKISQIIEEQFPKYTRKAKKFDLDVFTGKAWLFNLNLSMKPVKKFFIYKRKL